MLQFWPLVLVLFGAALVIQSFQRADPAQPARAHDGFHFGWVILWVLFWTFGWNSFTPMTVRSDSSETAKVVAVMSRHQQTSTAAIFRGAEVTTIMGRADLDLRIHRRYVLTLTRLARIEMGVTDSRIAVLTDGTQLPISRTGYGKLRELL